MKLSEGIKNHGKPFEIPDCSRDELPQFFVEMGYITGAEIGIHKGEYNEKFCKAGLKMYAIDPWKAYQGSGRSQADQARQDFLFGHTGRLLAPYPNSTIIRKTSTDALSDFADESLDFVYIDGNHDFSHVAEDLYSWSQKVRKGGIVSGHDYFMTAPGARNVVCHVKAVVDAFVETFAIPDFYTFGRSKPLDQESRNDSTLSWMFFKP